jgi:hypothetical protein
LVPLAGSLGATGSLFNCSDGAAYTNRIEGCHRKKGQDKEVPMIRWIVAAGFALSLETSVQAMTPAPIAQPDNMITRVAVGCGAGRTRVNGVCVARTTIRHTRRAVRRCLRWNGSICALYE